MTRYNVESGDLLRVVWDETPADAARQAVQLGRWNALGALVMVTPAGGEAVYLSTRGVLDATTTRAE